MKVLLLFLCVISSLFIVSVVFHCHLHCDFFNIYNSSSKMLEKHFPCKKANL